jgi:hypothetical protein
MQRKEQDVNIRSPTFQQRIERWPTSRRRRLPVDLPYYVMSWPDGCGGLDQLTGTDELTPGAWG